MTPRLLPELLRAALASGWPVVGHPATRESLRGADLTSFTAATTLTELQAALGHADRPVLDDTLSSVLLGRPPEPWMHRVGAVLLPNRMTLHTDNAEQARFDLYGWYGLLLTREAVSRYLAVLTASGVIGEEGYVGDTAEREGLLDLVYLSKLPHRPDTASGAYMPELKGALLAQGELTTLEPQ